MAVTGPDCLLVRHSGFGLHKAAARETLDTRETFNPRETFNTRETCKMAEEMAQDRMDPNEQRRTYKSVMRISSEIGVPFVLALTMFFTNLVMRNGLGIAILAAAVTYLFVYFIVKTFFSH